MSIKRGIIVGLVLLVLLALAAQQVGAQSGDANTSEAVQLAESWQELILTVVIIVVGGGLLYTVLTIVKRIVSPEYLNAAADAFERGFERGKERAERTPTPVDDIVFEIAEPVASAILELLREKQDGSPETRG